MFIILNKMLKEFYGKVKYPSAITMLEPYL